MKNAQKDETQQRLGGGKRYSEEGSQGKLLRGGSILVGVGSTGITGSKSGEGA